MMGGVYEHIVVPMDTNKEGRAALAPAGDLAWRFDARLVVVTTSPVVDKDSRDLLKGKAMMQSGPDADFWVDDKARTLGEAVVSTARFRSNPLAVVASRGHSKLRPKDLHPVAAEVVGGVECPVVLVGPRAGMAAGLALNELVVWLDGSASTESILPMATEWARLLRLRLVLVGVVPSKDTARVGGERSYLEQHAAALRGTVSEVDVIVHEAKDAGHGLVELVDGRADALLAMSTAGRGGAKHGPLGRVPATVVATSSRAVVLQRPPR
jgi:nucleotide-binding universal stress UspA family protein